MAKNYYSGRYKVQNIYKYSGDPTKVVYRSFWERQVFRMMDVNPSVKRWSSEEIVIPYMCPTDGKMHRYFPDLYFETNKGKRYIIEIKPHKQTQEPKVKNKSPRAINEVATFAKNRSKWDMAEQYCQKKGIIFQIWTEHTLTKMGLKIKVS